MSDNDDDGDDDGDDDVDDDVVIGDGVDDGGGSNDAMTIMIIMITTTCKHLTHLTPRPPSSRSCFVARRDIAAGEELRWNYFAGKEGKDKRESMYEDVDDDDVGDDAAFADDDDDCRDEDDDADDDENQHHYHHDACR